MLYGLEGEELEDEKQQIEKIQMSRQIKLEEIRHERKHHRKQDHDAMHHYPLMAKKLPLAKLTKLAGMHDPDPIFEKIPVNDNLAPAHHHHHDNGMGFLLAAINAANGQHGGKFTRPEFIFI